MLLNSQKTCKASLEEGLVSLESTSLHCWTNMIIVGSSVTGKKVTGGVSTWHLDFGIL